MNSLFTVIDQLLESRPVTQSGLEERFGVKFAERTLESTEYFRVLHAGPSAKVPGIAHVELRVPVEPATVSAGVQVIFSVDPAAQCISVADILGHFGPRPVVMPPNPRQPASAPVEYAYTQIWGQLSFGVARSAPRCLTRVIFQFMKSV